ncbi:unnamed protein product [Macrosiphum euphorbiae]|uniref:Transposase n=1 Tax=Macrosiphum euphorbiae TaxID=13131 RepID=A0AAV0YAD6_9HEMI|nr:unnamed protein product [Macrosiphum euphorbiae]
MADTLVSLAGARSDVWKSFGFKVDDSGVIINHKKVTCRNCLLAIGYSGNTSNLKSHLQQCTKGKSESKISISTFFTSSKSKLSSNSKRHKELTKGLLNFVVRDVRPFNLIEGKGFRAFMNLAVPEYVVPSNATITRLSDHITSKEKLNFKTHLKNIPHICLTIDFWTSRAVNSYLGVTCHFIENWKLKSRVLETVNIEESHTSLNIVKNLKTIINDYWEMDGRVCAIVCDNAPNMTKAVRHLEHVNLVRCSAHSIQLAINYGLKDESITDLLITLRKIVGHFHRSAVAQHNLEQEQDKLQIPKSKLVQDCITRWNSTHDMMGSLTKNREAVNNCLRSNPKTEEWYITVSQNDTMTDLINILEPFKTATEILGGDKYVTLSIVGRLFKNLISSLECIQTDSVTIKDIKLLISSDLKKRQDKMGDIIHKAAALDPRYRSLKYLSEEDSQNTWASLETELLENTVNYNENEKQPCTSQCSVEEREDTVDQPRNKKMKKSHSLLADSDDEDSHDEDEDMADEGLQQLKRYRQYAEIVPKNIDPLVWWKANSYKFPVIAKLARKYLCIVATSVPSERLFSQAGQVVSQKRARLMPSRVNDLLFLNSFLRTEESINDEEFKYEETEENI